MEEKINPAILRIPACGTCIICKDKNSRKLCMKRGELRTKLVSEYELELEIMKSKIKSSIKEKKENFNTKKRKHETLLDNKGNRNNIKKSNEKRKATRPSIGGEINRGNPLGNKRMSVPDELLPELCRRIGANGTRNRMATINNFVLDHPTTSIRQVTLKFSQVTTKELPPCVPAPEKHKGRAFNFFLRPRYYHLLPDEQRPLNWEKYAR